MEIIEYSLSTIKVLEKPKNYAQIHRSFVTKKTSFKEVADNISNGHSFSCGSFDGPRKTKNFKQAQLVALDFDDNEDWLEIQKKLKQYNLNVNLYYRTFSWKPDFHKFRLILLLEKNMNDLTAYKDICKALVTLTAIFIKSCLKKRISPRNAIYRVLKTRKDVFEIREANRKNILKFGETETDDNKK